VAALSTHALHIRLWLTGSSFTNSHLRAPSALKARVLLHATQSVEVSKPSSSSRSTGKPRRSVKSTDNSTASLEWLSKQDRQDLKDPLWHDAQALPYLLQGTMGSTLQGVVEDVTEMGARVRLLWVSQSTRVPAGYRSGPKLSPISGMVGKASIAHTFGLRKRPSTADLQGFLHEGQHVSVQVRPTDVQDPDMLSLELADVQPLTPVSYAAQTGTSATKPQWVQFLTSECCRVFSATPGETWQASLPPMQWDDPVWVDVFAQLPTKLKQRHGSTIPSAVAASWALADTRKDVVAVGPLLADERLMMFLVPLLKHLKAQSAPVAGSGPTAVIIGGESFQRTFSQAAQELSDNDLSVELLHWRQSKKASGSQVMVGSPSELLNAASEHPNMFSRVSFVAVDNLEASNEKGLELHSLLQLLPSHKWGPSLIWTPHLSADLQSVVLAFAEHPSFVQVGTSVWNPQLRNEVHNLTEVQSRATVLVHRYPGFRVAVFADDPEAMKAKIQSSDSQARLSAQEGNAAYVAVLPNQEKFTQKIVPFDVMVHVDAPPDRKELLHRLGACRQLSVALLGAENGALTPPWLSYAAHAYLLESGKERAFLKSLYQEPLKVKRTKKQALPTLTDVTEASKKSSDVWGETARFADDFKVDGSNVLVWSAGEEDDEDVQLP